MSTVIDAIFENGILRPLHALPLAERQRVKLTIDETAGSDQIAFALSSEQWEAFIEALDSPAKVIPSLQNLLRSPGVFDDR